MDADKATWQKGFEEAAGCFTAINESLAKAMERFRSVDGALTRRSDAIREMKVQCDQQEARIEGLEKEVEELKETKEQLLLLQTQVRVLHWVSFIRKLMLVLLDEFPGGVFSQCSGMYLFHGCR